MTPRARSLALVATAAILGLSVTGGPAHAAASGPPIVVIRLGEFTPAAPVAGEELTISGNFVTLASGGTGALSVRLRLLAPLAGRSDVGPALNPSIPRGGTTVTTRSVAIASNAGDVVPWSISLPVNSLHLTTAGVYPVEIDAITAGKTVGVTRTLLPWLPKSTVLQKLGVTVVWPITATPNVDANGVYQDESVPQSMASDGRLGVLSSVAATAPGVSPAIDPFVLQSASQGAAGYRVAVPGSVGKTTAGINEASMATWLATTEAVMRGHQSWLLPYANIDAAAMLDARQGALVTASLRSATTAASDALGELSADPHIVIPSDGYLTRSQVQQLVHDGATSFVVTSSMFPPKVQLSYTPSGRADLRTKSGIAHFALADAALSNTVSRAATANPVTLRQRLLGESLFVALELPSVHRSIVVSPLGLWSPTSAGAQAVVDGLLNSRWTTPVPLTALLAQAPPSVGHLLRRPPTVAVRARLSAGQVASIVRADPAVRDLTSVIDAADPVLVTARQGQVRAASQGWRPLPAEGRAFAASYYTDVTALRDSLSVKAPSTVVIPGQSGVLPVTVVNDLASAVHVHLMIVGNPSFRIKFKDPGLLNVDAKSRHSLEIPITVFGSGALHLDVLLTGDEGRVVTARYLVQIRSSAYSRVALYVAGLAFIALLGLSIASITRRVRRRGQDEA